MCIRDSPYHIWFIEIVWAPIQAKQNLHMLIAIPKCRASMLLDNDTLEVNTVTHVVGGQNLQLDIWIVFSINLPLNIYLQERSEKWLKDAHARTTTYYSSMCWWCENWEGRLNTLFDVKSERRHDGMSKQTVFDICKD